MPILFNEPVVLVNLPNLLLYFLSSAHAEKAQAEKGEEKQQERQEKKVCRSISKSFSQSEPSTSDGFGLLKQTTTQSFRQPLGGTTCNGLYGEAPPERVAFFRLQVYERVGISRAEVYKRVGKSVVWVFKRAFN